MKTIKTFADDEQLTRFAAEKFVEISYVSIHSSGNFTVALSGGSTPKSLYQLLSSDEFKNKIDWSKVFFFFGDERNVLPDNSESNYRMADENLFKPLKISDENVFRWQTEIKNAETIAEKYELTIRNFFEDRKNSAVSVNDFNFPRFDLILLGMGDDGHTASLFPFTQGINEMEKIALANPVEKLKTTRLTLTFPVIDCARKVIFLVKGADKAETLREVLNGEFQPDKFPAQSVKLPSGELFWLIDTQAAALLDG
jgi:6-phosphogluconolactonase